MTKAATISSPTSKQKKASPKIVASSPKQAKPQPPRSGKPSGTAAVARRAQVKSLGAKPANPFPSWASGLRRADWKPSRNYYSTCPPIRLAFVLVQHLDPTHESILTDLLAKTTVLPVHEVQNNMPLEPNQVYVIPPNTDMTMAGGVLKLVEGRRETGAHHSIDHFLESLAQDRGPQAIGVILSGSASDGTLGLEAIKNEGGITFAQDGSAKYDSMPRSAIASGCVDFVLPPAKIAEELANIARHPHLASLRAPAARRLCQGDRRLQKGAAVAPERAPGSISPCTNPPPSSGGSPGAWC